MSKLSLDALRERAEATTSTELMETINGGTANSCHPQTPTTTYPSLPRTESEVKDLIGNTIEIIGNWLLN